MLVNKFDGVIGQKEQQEELLNVISWFNNYNEYESKGLSIPKGVILYGDPGNGKTFLLKKVKTIIDCEVLVFKDNGDNIIKSVNDIFDKAQALEKAVIIFDEFDLLIENNHNVIRIFQERIDGIDSKSNILILCAANSISRIPEPLTRQGRLEKLIYVPYLKEEELVDMFFYYANLYEVKFLVEPDKVCLSQGLNHVSCAGIKAIVNDLVLRNGNIIKDNDKIYESIFNITSRSACINYENNRYIAYHEAGHAIMMNYYKDYFKISSLSLYFSSGALKGFNNKYKFDTYEMMIANIQVAYAGPMASKILYKTCDSGCQSDLEIARKYAYCLINKCGYRGFYKTLPNVSNTTRQESEILRFCNEKLIKRLLKRQERLTYKFIKKHINEVKRLGDLLFEKRFLNANEVIKCLQD